MTRKKRRKKMPGTENVQATVKPGAQTAMVVTGSLGFVALFVWLAVASTSAMVGYTRANWDYKDNFCKTGDGDDDMECGPANATIKLSKKKAESRQLNSRVFIFLFWFSMVLNLVAIARKTRKH